MTPVPRIGRILDLVGLGLFLAGGALFGWSWVGFRGVPDFQRSPDDPPWAAIRVADGYWRLQKVGVAVMIAGLVVFVVAWWVARRPSRSSEAEMPTPDAGGATPVGGADGSAGPDGVQRPG